MFEITTCFFTKSFVELELVDPGGEVSDVSNVGCHMELNNLLWNLHYDPIRSEQFWQIFDITLFVLHDLQVM